MRRLRALAIAVVVAATLAIGGVAYADPSAPTNGGSNLGGGQSGQCAGPLAERPAACD
jgi:hypothetical protein